MNETLTEWSDEQRRIFVDIEQVFAQYRAMRRELENYRGSMVWKRAHGREYLFRLRDRRGNGRSLGPRSADTEHIHNAFHTRKALLRERDHGLRERLSELARFARAARLPRVPKLATAILRELDRRHLFDRGLEIVGTHALYAYEAMAGVHIGSGLLATEDLDILWDDRVQLRLPRPNLRGGILAALRNVDASFATPQRNGFSAANNKGFLVDMIRPHHGDEVLRNRPDAIGEDDLKAAPIESLRWVVNTPAREQTAIAADGFPVHLVVPDPRVFAMQKLDTSTSVMRGHNKRARDEHQAQVMASILRRYLPDMPVPDPALRALPATLRERFTALLGIEVAHGDPFGDPLADEEDTPGNGPGM